MEDYLSKTFTVSDFGSKLPSTSLASNMTEMFRAKVLILGPPGCGKTVLANFLSDATESISAEYRPTKGVRIVEFESEKMMIRGRKINAEVELWDCGSDKRSETCWPIFAQQVNGIIFVFNSGVDSHARYIERIHSHFVRKLGLLRDSQCIIFVNRKSDGQSGNDAGSSTETENHLVPPVVTTGRFERDATGPLKNLREVPTSMREISCVSTDVARAPDELRSAFGAYLNRILGLMAEQTDKMEQSILSTGYGEIE